MTDSNPLVQRLVLGPLQTNCYLLVCPTTKAAMVIDPADEPARIMAAAAAQSATIQQIVLTHLHRDHLGALLDLREATGATVMAHRDDVAMAEESALFYGPAVRQTPGAFPDRLLEGGEQLSLGSQTVSVIHTPGHTPGGITLHVGKHLFTGDTLFAGGVGRVDLPGGDWQILLASLKQLTAFPDDATVYPGHGPSSTIGAEKKANPYL